jgi:hypothetical protein
MVVRIMTRLLEFEESLRPPGGTELACPCAGPVSIAHKEPVGVAFHTKILQQAGLFGACDCGWQPPRCVLHHWQHHQPLCRMPTIILVSSDITLPAARWLSVHALLRCALLHPAAYPEEPDDDAGASSSGGDKAGLPSHASSASLQDADQPPPGSVCARTHA